MAGVKNGGVGLVVTIRLCTIDTQRKASSWKYSTPVTLRSCNGESTVKASGKRKEKWVGMPPPTEEHIEEEVVCCTFAIVEFKKRNDRPGARWKVGTINDVMEKLRNLESPKIVYGQEGWHTGSAQKAATEIAEFHGMEIDGTLRADDVGIYVYTDRAPTKRERSRRESEPLTVKQKRVFRAIKEYAEHNGRGPTKTELMRIMGHKSATTTNGFLNVLERKNWIIAEGGRRRIELL